MPITSTNQQAVLSLASATPGNSAIGDAATAGTSGSVARADHVHGREAAGTAGASAVGDTASAGSATTVARSDHRHSREAFGTPVNIDASVTSLSAGSLTTVARADHVHTVSKVRVLIASTTLGSAVASYTFSNIPSTFNHLELITSGRGTHAAVWIEMDATFNSDVYGTGTSYWAGDGTATNKVSFVFAGYLHGSTNGYSGPASSHFLINDYSSTSLRKTMRTFGTVNNSTTIATTNGGPFCSFWDNTAAITSIKLQVQYGNIDSGTRFYLYGY